MFAGPSTLLATAAAALLPLVLAAPVLPSSTAGQDGIEVAAGISLPRLGRRAEIASDAVVGFPQLIPSGTAGALYTKFQPLLTVVNGCVPFPAVDAQGNTNAGLNPTGDPSGQCSSSTGQVYARSTTYSSRFGIMYSWYMPKDSPSSGLGHRHEWENVVVWLSSASLTASILGVSASAHGDYQTNTSPPLSGTRPLVSYYSTWPINHQMGYTTAVGGSQPLVAWESLPDVARQALTSTDFGAATVPFKDATFQDNLAKAF